MTGKNEGIKKMNFEMITMDLIRNGKLNIKQLAERMGMSENYLYKMSMPDWNQAHADIHFRTITAIAKHQGSLALAKYVAKTFGGLFVTDVMVMI